MATINKKSRSDGQKQTVQNTQAGLQLLPLIMNNIPQAVFWKDRNLVYLGCNRAFAEDAGFSSPEEVVGKTDFDMPWKEQADLYRADDRLVLENGQPKLNYEEPQTTPAGTTIWLRTSKIPIQEAGGTVAVLGMYEDITEYKKAQEAIHSEKQRFQTILETVRVPTIISRLSDGIVLYANQAIAEVSQVNLDKLIGFKTGNFYANPDDRKTVLETLRQHGHINEFEVQFRRTDGSLYWALLSSRIIQYEGEACVLSTYVDVTERKEVEQALRDSEARYSAVVTQAKDGIVIIQDNILKFVNDAMAAMVGAPASEMINTPIINYIADESKELIVNRIKARLAGQEVPNLYEAKLKRKDGTIFDAELSAGAIEYHGRPADAGMIRDVTERKRTEEALKAHDEFSQKQSATFAELTRSETLYSGNLQAAFAEVTEAAARTLNIDRSSIWYYNEDRTEIRCMDLYEEGKGHSEGIVLGKADFPAYFKALEDEKVIAADNAHTHPATREFSAVYLTPLGINSMLDAPIRLRGRVIGVICNEHVGPFRSWTTEEQNFARTIVDFVTVAVETQERKQAEEAVQQSEERFRRFTEATSEGLVFHEQGKIIDANPAGLAMFGLTQSSDFVGRNLLEFVLPEFHKLIVEKMQMEDVPAYEVQCRRADGSSFPVETATRTYQIGERTIRATSIRDITERKRTEEIVQQSRARFQGLVETLSDWIWEVNPQGCYTYVSPKIKDLLGYEPEEVLGKTPFDLMPPEEAQRVAGVFGPLLSTQQPLNALENTNLHKDGHLVVFETSGVPFFDAQGNFMGYRGTDRDITERKQAEEALKAHDAFSQKQSSVFAELTRSEKLYSGDIETAFAAVTEAAAQTLNIQRSSIWYYNENHTEIRCMDLFEQGKGHSAGIALSKADFPSYFKALEDEKVIAADNAHTHPATREFSAAYLTPLGINSMLDAPIRLRGRVIGVICNEHVGPFHSWTTEEQNFASTIVDFVTVAVETQERKQAEERIRTFQALTENATDAIVMANLEGRLTYANRAFYNLAGVTYGKDDLIGQPIASFTPEEQRAQQGEAIRQALTTGGWSGEAEQTRRDGSRVAVSVSVFPLLNESGQPVSVNAIMHDITERKKLEQQIQTALERRGLQVQLSTQVSQSIATAPVLEELYERVVTQIKEQFGYYHTQLLRYDPAREAVVLVTGYGEVGAKMLAAGHRLPMGEGLIGTAAATGETVLRPALENDPDWHPNPLLPDTKGEVAVPIKLGDTILGVLDVQSSVTDALDTDDQLLLEGLCGQIAIAIESTRLRQEMAERLEEIGRLYRAMSAEGWKTYRETADVPSSFVYDQAGLRSVESSGLAEELFASIPLTVPGGEVIGTLGVADDPQHPISAEDEAFLQQVSEQVALALESARLFEQTQQQRGQLNEALDIAKLANWEYDVNRDRFIFNDHFYSIFHTTVEQVGGYEISSAEYAERFVHPDDRPMVGQEIGKALSSTDRHYNVLLEHRILFADGGVGHIAVNVHIERDEQGNIVRYYGANQDITERKLAEEAIAKRATELATVAQVSTTTSTMLDPDQLLQTVVDLTKDRFGLYHAHIYIADETWNTLLLAAGAGEVGRRLVADQHAIPISLEESLVARAARERKAIIINDVASEPGFLPNPLLPATCAELAVPMVVGDKLLGVFDVQSDRPSGFSEEDANIYITLATQVGVALQNARLYMEQAALVTQLRELDKLKSSFLANMSHELRTPLNSILGFADVIIEELDGPLTENMSNDLRLIQKNGQHLLHLINDVLDMAKIEAGRMNLNPETFKAYEVLEEVTSITSTLASEKNLSLFIEQDADRKVEIYADRTRLRQVMINLVNNAIKFTDSGRISLNLAPLEGARILITVKDTGLGIPADKLDAIFLEFTQVDASSTRKAGGTGLGLPISRRLVEMHGGRLWAESAGVPGEGSTFFVELPIEARITETVEKQVK